MKIAINGFGRIGRGVLRALFQRKDHSLEVVGINDLTSPETLAHLLKYDSVHGTFNADVAVEGSDLIVHGKRIRVSKERDPKMLPWAALQVHTVIESTGHFTDGEEAKAHIQAGAKRVVISAPAKNVDATIAVGVNHDIFDPSKHVVISNASCTTNCLAPVAKVLDENFGIEQGLMTTIHSVTNDQRVLDLPHEDLRRARAAYESMIPTSTGAAKAIGLVLPKLHGKLNGLSVRVPTKNVSLVDLVATLSKDVTKDMVNQAFVKASSEGPLKDILCASKAPLVSSDYNGNPASSTVDLALTDVMGSRLVKVIAWYDNEWGYSNRVIDVVKLVAR